MKLKLFSLLFVVVCQSSQSAIVLSEIHYNPPEAGSDDEDEFLELTNTGEMVVNLGGYRFGDGIEFTFPADTILGSRETILLAADIASLTASDFAGKIGGGAGGHQLYEVSEGTRIFEWFGGSRLQGDWLERACPRSW